MCQQPLRINSSIWLDYTNILRALIPAWLHDSWRSRDDVRLNMSSWDLSGNPFVQYRDWILICNMDLPI